MVKVVVVVGTVDDVVVIVGTVDDVVVVVGTVDDVVAVVVEVVEVVGVVGRAIAICRFTTMNSPSVFGTHNIRQRNAYGCHSPILQPFNASGSIRSNRVERVRVGTCVHFENLMY